MNGTEFQEWSVEIRTLTPGGPNALWHHDNFANKAGDTSEKRAKRSADREIKGLMESLAEQSGGIPEHTTWWRPTQSRRVLTKCVRLMGATYSYYFFVTLTPWHTTAIAKGGVYLSNYRPDEGLEFKPMV